MSDTKKKVLIVLSSIPVFFLYLWFTYPLLSNDRIILVLLFGVSLIVFWPSMLGKLIGLQINTYTWFPIAGDPDYKHYAIAILWMVLGLIVAGPAIIMGISSLFK